MTRAKLSDSERFWSRVQGGPDCWLWTGTLSSGTGYGKFWLSGATVGAHRVAWILAYGFIPAGLQICHHCDNRRCVRPSHLFLGTQADNMADAKAKGRTSAPRPNARGPRSATHGVYGERQYNARLNAEAVRSIRRRYPEETLSNLAIEFGVSRAVIYDAARGKTWRHVDAPAAAPSYTKPSVRRERVALIGDLWPVVEAVRR